MGWDLGRFVQTLVDFDVVPGVGWWQRLARGEASIGGLRMDGPGTGVAEGEWVIFEFGVGGTQRRSQATLWGALDDVVMGGVSASHLQLTDTVVLFTGNVSTANSGGFASVRTRNLDPALDLSGYEGLRLRVQGDGNRYKFLLRSSAGWDSLAYAYSFDTVVDTWIDVTVPFADLVPTQRARTVQNATPLDQQRVYSLQLMLSKFEYDGQLNPHFTPGQFTLAVESIVAYAN